MAVIRKSEKHTKITTLQMELTVSRFVNIRQNILVPNVSWGMFKHECDLIQLSKSGYATEYEIKISKSDLKADQKKYHGHDDPKIRYLYFVIPWYLEKDIDLIPERAGIIIVHERVLREKNTGVVTIDEKLHCKKIREAKSNYMYKFSIEERIRLLELMAMRIWNLKRKLNG